MDLRNNPAAKSRGIRNNNPFNLQKTSIAWKGKVKGTDSRFETFDTVENGIRAGIIDITGDIAKDGKNTLNKLFQEFAPKHENDTTAYINYVSKATGINPDQSLVSTSTKKIDPFFLIKLSAAIIAQENGPQQAALIPASVIQTAVLDAINTGSIKKYIDLTPLPQTAGKYTFRQMDMLALILTAGIVIFIFLTLSNLK